MSFIVQVSHNYNSKVVWIRVWNGPCVCVTMAHKVSCYGWDT